MKAAKGFTLLELLIYIALVSVISVVLSRMFIIINSGRARITSKTAVDSNLRFAVEKIEQDVRAASSVTTPGTAGATSTLLVLSVNSSTITYSSSADGYLKRQVNSSTPESLTEDSVAVNTSTVPLTFSRLENNNPIFLPQKTGVAIQVMINIKYRSESPDWQYNETKKTTILLR
jgi:prepilin-type N-terminal cleavage/methylation domain-containing protein